MPNPYTPRLTATFVQGGASQAFLRPSAGNRGGVGRLPSSAGDALAIINGFRAEGAEPLTEESVYVHYLEAANNAFVSDRFCFLGEDTLKNIATDAAAGFAFMNSHRTGGYGSSSELPLGRTFCGRFERVTPDGDGDEGGVDIDHDGDDATRRTVVGIYMLAGVAPNGAAGISTDDMHRSIDARTIFDCSVGLYGGQAICDVCGHGVWDYDRESGRFLCPHMPGTDYQMTPEQVAAQSARGVTNGYCSYTLSGANCNEVSAVYDGAVPGAGFVKAALSPSDGPTRAELVAKLSAGYGLPFTVSDLEELSQRFQSGTPGVSLPPKAEVRTSGAEAVLPHHSPIPTAENTGKDKKPMKFTKAGLRALFGLGAEDPIEIVEGDALPTPPASNPQTDAALATLTTNVTALAATVTAQNATIAALTESLATSQKTAEENAKAAQLSADKARILALKKAFKITPAAAVELTTLAETAPAAFAIAVKAFEANGPVITVAGIPGFSPVPPTVTSGDELASDDPREVAETLERLAKEKTKANPKLAYHDAINEVLRERPDLGNAYAASRGVN